MTGSGLRRELAKGALHAAPFLLGAKLIRGELQAVIVEVEAYEQHGDPGCHAHRGMTPRNRVMFGPPGLAYIYFTYGNHWMLNITAAKPGTGSAILIRAAMPTAGKELMRCRRPKARSDAQLLNGPGKLAAAFGITSLEYGLDLLDPSSSIRVVAPDALRPFRTGPRIGLAAGKGDELPWRFVDSERIAWCSRPLP